MTKKIGVKMISNSQSGDPPCTITTKVSEAYENALRYRQKAYAPYSKFIVGAAVKVKGHDEFFVGCNVENASYGASICAEQMAITQAVTQKPGAKLEFLVLVTDTNPVAAPCGICLQIMNEFYDIDFYLYLANLQGIQESYSFKELLPLGFNHSYISRL
jgi:cytidine deaminase